MDRIGRLRRARNLRRVTALDWVIVAFCALLAVYGYLQGFIVGVLSLLGFAIGAFLGSRLGPLVLSGGSRSPYAPLFGLIGALLIGALFASGLEGLGVRARSVLRLPGLRQVDGALGAALTACVGLGIAWIAGALAVQTAGSISLRRDLQQSVILKELNQLLPPSGPILNALARIDPLPSVNGPAAGVPPPTKGILGVPRVRSTFGSVVRVVGTACGLGIEGSGWVAGGDLVVTNAHVVAGETDTTVQPGGTPPNLSAHAIDFDARDDIAVLRVPGLNRRPLALAAAPRTGEAAAILGYPLDGPFTAVPGRIGPTRVVSTENAYGQGPVLRTIESLRGLVRPGNSGGPLIDAAGEVVGTVFASITGGTVAAGGDGLAVPNSIVRRQLAIASSRGRAVSTGQCAG
jgi:S1-C subfamily serine protease